MKSDYYILKEIIVEKQGQLIAFETKLAANAKRLVGFKISANSHHDTKALAIVGISFNGARQNTINKELLVPKPSNLRSRSELLGQNMQLLPNSYAKGFVEDLGVATLPYTVKLYFKLSKH